MTLLQILVVLAVVAAVAAVAAGVWRHGDAAGGADADHRTDGVGLPEPTSTRPALQLPVDRLTSRDVDRLRFSTGLRGYRMDEVDAVLDRVSAELRDRQAELEALREQLSAPAGADLRSPAEAASSQAGPDVEES